VGGDDGGDEASFGAEGMHRRPLEEFSPVIEQTALFCGMRWEPPLVLHGAHRVADSVLEDAADEYRARLEQLVGEARAPGLPRPPCHGGGVSEHSMLLDAIVYLGGRGGVRAHRQPAEARLRARLPRAGCIIGPFGLRIVKDSEATLHFAEFGVVLMLFVIGLELDPKQLWKLRAPCSAAARCTARCGAAARRGRAAARLPWQAALVSGSRSGCRPRR
jgi:hypothetical protein